MIFKISIGSLCLFKSHLLKDVFNMKRENLGFLTGDRFIDRMYRSRPNLLQGSIKSRYLKALSIYPHRRSNTCRDIKPIQERIDFDRHITCCRLSGTYV